MRCSRCRAFGGPSQVRVHQGHRGSPAAGEAPPCRESVGTPRLQRQRRRAFGLGDCARLELRTNIAPVAKARCAMTGYYANKRVPMRVQARSGSLTEARYLSRSALPSEAWPQQDLVFHGGKVVPQME